MLHCSRFRSTVTLLATVILATVSHAQDARRLLPYKTLTVVVNPLDARKLIVGNTDHRLFRSDDGGLSWSTFYSGNPGPGNSLSSVAISRVDTAVTMIGGFLYDGIRRSGNSGASYQRALFDPNGLRMWFISDAIVEDPKADDVFYAARGMGGNVFYRSTDRGVVWDSIATISPSITPRVCTMTVRPDSTDNIFLGCQGGVLLHSTDGGRSFERRTLDGVLRLRNDSEIPKIVFSRKDPRRGYLVVAIANAETMKGNGGLYRTLDGGYTWNSVAMVDTSLWAVELVERNDEEHLWVGGFRLSSNPSVIPGNGVLAWSADGGTSFTHVSAFPWGESLDGDTSRNAWMFRYDPRADRLYLGMETGLFSVDYTPVSVTDSPLPSEPSPLSVMSRQGAVEVRWRGTTPVTIGLVDVQGRSCAATMPTAEGATEYHLTTSGLAPGIYFVTAQTAAGIQSEPVLITTP